MGKLTTLNQIEFIADWYFTDAYIKGNRYNYKWPSPDFPHRICMHNDMLNSYNDRKITIRKWIDHTITDTVILDHVRMDYRKFYGKSYEWGKGYDIHNSWVRFSFENEHSASMFALVFSEWIQIPTLWHPDHPEDEEYLSRPLAQRYIE